MLTASSSGWPGRNEPLPRPKITLTPEQQTEVGQASDDPVGARAAEQLSGVRDRGDRALVEQLFWLEVGVAPVLNGAFSKKQEQQRAKRSSI